MQKHREQCRTLLTLQQGRTTPALCRPFEALPFRTCLLGTSGQQGYEKRRCSCVGLVRGPGFRYFERWGTRPTSWNHKKNSWGSGAPTDSWGQHQNQSGWAKPVLSGLPKALSWFALTRPWKRGNEDKDTLCSLTTETEMKRNSEQWALLEQNHSCFLLFWCKIHKSRRKHPLSLHRHPLYTQASLQHEGIYHGQRHLLCARSSPKWRKHQEKQPRDCLWPLWAAPGRKLKLKEL